MRHCVYIFKNHIFIHFQTHNLLLYAKWFPKEERKERGEEGSTEEGGRKREEGKREEGGSREEGGKEREGREERREGAEGGSLRHQNKDREEGHRKAQEEAEAVEHTLAREQDSHPRHNPPMWQVPPGPPESMLLVSQGQTRASQRRPWLPAHPMTPTWEQGVDVPQFLEFPPFKCGMSNLPLLLDQP